MDRIIFLPNLSPSVRFCFCFFGKIDSFLSLLKKYQIFFSVCQQVAWADIHNIFFFCSFLCFRGRSRWRSQAAAVRCAGSSFQVCRARSAQENTPPASCVRQLLLPSTHALPPLSCGDFQITLAASRKIFYSLPRK